MRRLPTPPSPLPSLPRRMRKPQQPRSMWRERPPRNRRPRVPTGRRNRHRRRRLPAPILRPLPAPRPAPLPVLLPAPRPVPLLPRLRAPRPVPPSLPPPHRPPSPVRTTRPSLRRRGSSMKMAGASCRQPATPPGLPRKPWRYACGRVAEHPVWVSEAQGVDGRTWSRVRIGPVPSAADLAALTAALEDLGFGSLVVPEEDFGAQPSAATPPMVVQQDGARFVQAGAYAARSAAAELAARLQALTGHGTHVAASASPDHRSLYRVRIGPMATHEALVALADRLEVAGYGVMDIPPPDDANAPAAPGPPPGRIATTACHGARGRCTVRTDRGLRQAGNGRGSRGPATRADRPPGRS